MHEILQQKEEVMKNSKLFFTVEKKKKQEKNKVHATTLSRPCHPALLCMSMLKYINISCLQDIEGIVKYYIHT